MEELKKLDESNIISYVQAGFNEELIFLLPREDDKTINRVSKNIQNYLTQQIKKTEELVSFIKNNTVCRSVQLLKYFGEKNSANCTICDVCISNKKINSKDLHQKIIDLLKKEKEISKEEIIFHLNVDEKSILIHLRYLLSKDRVSITNNNKFFVR